jgi:phosphoribosylaminoimidazole-succinocarboxamide synthase
MQESEKFDQPLFTPSTKAETGHDENISFEQMVDIIGREDAETLQDISLTIYNKAAEYARKKGIIIADTKFEFGKIDDQIIIVDELLTPDSSRFWPADSYTPGRRQESFDKQFVRDYLSSTGWDKNSTPPHLPDHVVDGTKQRYLEAYEQLTGKKLSIE